MCVYVFEGMPTREAIQSALYLLFLFPNRFIFVKSGKGASGVRYWLWGMKPGTLRAVQDEHRCPLVLWPSPLDGNSHSSAVRVAVSHARADLWGLNPSSNPASSDARWLLKLEIAIMCPVVVRCTGLYQRLHLC